MGHRGARETAIGRFWLVAVVRLSRLAGAVAAIDPDRAEPLVISAVCIAVHQSELYARDQVLVGLVEAVAAGGPYERAETLAAKIADPARRAETLVRPVHSKHPCPVWLPTEVEDLVKIADPAGRAGTVVRTRRFFR